MYFFIVTFTYLINMQFTRIRSKSIVYVSRKLTCSQPSCNEWDKRNLIASFVHVTSLTGHFLIIALRAFVKFFRWPSFFDTSIKRKKYYLITNQFVYKLFESEIKKKIKGYKTLLTKVSCWMITPDTNN